MSESNPFSGLFQSESTTNQNNPLNEKINNLIENIFSITIRKNPLNKKPLIFLEEASANYPIGLLNLQILEEALFERILIFYPREFLIPNDQDDKESDEVAEMEAIHYLFRVYTRVEQFNDQNDPAIRDACLRINELIFRNVSTAMMQPDLFNGQYFWEQWFIILKTSEHDFEVKSKFLSLAAKEILKEDEIAGTECLKKFLNHILNSTRESLKKCTLGSFEKWIFPLLMSFVADKTTPQQLGEILLDHSTPPADSDGDKYANTVLGQLLSISIIPKSAHSSYEFYENPLSTQRSYSESIWNYLSNHLSSMHLLFKGLLLQGGEVKNKTLHWIGDCLNANTPRGQLWNNHAQSSTSLKTSSDSFMLGLGGVLLRLCQPLFKPQLKVLMVDPTYCAVGNDDRASKGVHMKDVEKDTCLQPLEENQIRITAEKYNFVTECFFMCHKALDLGYRVVIEKLIRMNRDINRLQGAFQDAMSANPSNPHIADMVKSRMTQFLSYHNTVNEPTNDELLNKFYDASATWLCQLAGGDETNRNPTNGFAPQTIQNIELPLTKEIPNILRSIPEYIIENIVCYLTFSRNFESDSYQRNPDSGDSIFTMILIFMGSAERVKNPHLRARLAEGLESLLPKQEERRSSFRSILHKKLFVDHPNRLEIVPNLLSVFVGIEMTGQSVQFEQKFNYRRPMYITMEYLWTLDEQKERFKNLAIDAVQHMDDVDPPIFLRFINLLINDAIFLLDDSLSNLQQIRTLQEAQDNGDWDSLPPNEKQQNIANLQHLGMLAKFDNLLGKDTLNMLKMLTSEIKGIFCEPSMVDRVAAMLNYFLLNLVGPKKGNFKVKDKKEFEFDPAETVLQICKIYVNLQDCEAFCLAVTLDGRSYSHQLFEFAEQVLVRIRGGQLIGEINEFAAKLEILDAKQKEESLALADAPDEFLDPIMSTLMVDPVLLPSSKVILDRSTISRHLLSDQSDPFNRSPLTMDQVKTDEELKKKIEDWIVERKEAWSKK